MLDIEHTESDQRKHPKRTRRDRKKRDDSDSSKKHNKVASIAKVLNPPFDPRILQIGPPQMRQLQRGFMVIADPKFAPGGTNTRHRINFLFNPQTVDVSHSLNPNIVAKPNAPPADPTSLGPQLNFGETSLSLYFDRTYELWDGSKKDTKAGKFGVYADILAFYIYLGICTTETEENPAAGAQGGGAGVTFPGGIPETMTGGSAARSSVRQVWTSLYPDSFMLYVPTYFYIGDKLKYYGKITGMSVTYTHWNINMVPQRAVVNLSISLDADPNKGKKLSLGADRITDPVGDKNRPGKNKNKKHDKPNKPHANPPVVIAPGM